MLLLDCFLRKLSKLGALEGWNWIDPGSGEPSLSSIDFTLMFYRAQIFDKLHYSESYKHSINIPTTKKKGEQTPEYRSRKPLLFSQTRDAPMAKHPSLIAPSPTSDPSSPSSAAQKDHVYSTNSSTSSHRYTLELPTTTRKSMSRRKHTLFARGRLQQPSYWRNCSGRKTRSSGYM